MSQPSGHPSDQPSSDLGANEWLVEEMYDQYRRDPQSVDPIWVEYFKTSPPDGQSGQASAAANGSPATQNKTTAAPAAPAAPAAQPSQPKHAAKVATGSTDEKKPVEKEADGPAPVAKPRPEAKAAEPAKGTTHPVPKEPVSSERPAASDQASYTILRGAPARTVQNMDASLSVPTATSVRSVPVKLLWDNRIVINNHLSRARGGKVSFTHLIGYALIKALKAMPEMNVGFDVVDGKPNLITPAHINLGLAIDVQKADGTRQLLVPSIKAAERMDFAAFWTAYEDVVIRTRDGKLTVEDFQGTTISPDQPRHHRHQPLGAAADEGPGRDPRRRRDGVPPGVPGRVRGDDRAQRDQQGDDADVHLRPPGDPGCSVG